MQVKTTDSFKRPRLRRWISCFTLLVGLPLLPVLLYFGYCWGVWGRNNLLLQHLFQCKCPSFSEEWRYPKQADVVISACHLDYSELSPSGKLLYVKEKDLAYLLDLESGKRVDVSKQPYSIFLTDELGFIEYPEAYLVDRMTGEQYPIQEFAHWQELNMPTVALQEAQYVFFDEYRGTLIVLAPDYLTRPEHNFYLSRFEFPSNDRDLMKQFLRKNNIAYQIVNNRFPGEVLSPDKRLVARDDGIYLVENNTLIVPSIPRLLVRGWINNGAAAIYTSHSFQPCLLEYLSTDGGACAISVPQPVIELKVPEAYLRPH